MIVGLGTDQTQIAPPPDVFQVVSSDPLPTPIIPETTTLQYQGGYYGQPLISTAGGYGGVSTVDPFRSNYEIGYGIGQWFRNNLLMVGIGVGALLLLKSGGSSGRGRR